MHAMAQMGLGEEALPRCTCADKPCVRARVPAPKFQAKPPELATTVPESPKEALDRVPYSDLHGSSCSQ